jgi:hypothetical protein
VHPTAGSSRLRSFADEDLLCPNRHALTRLRPAVTATAFHAAGLQAGGCLRLLNGCLRHAAAGTLSTPIRPQTPLTHDTGPKRTVLALLAYALLASANSRQGIQPLPTM